MYPAGSKTRFQFLIINEFCFLDVIGILYSVGRERVYERNHVATKFKAIELESNGIKLECTLFGPYVEALNEFLQSGCNENIVVVAQYLKVKLYNGEVQLQNAMNSTKLLFNPEIPEADNLKVCDNIGSPTQPFSYMKDTSEMSLEDELMNLGQHKTIEELKECQDVDEPTILPTVIGELVEQTMLFKIVVNNDNSGGVEDDLAADVVHIEVDATVVQDLGNKFDNIDAEEKCGDNG
ncbi:hypothetical protein RYX36_017244 [Vicia faba]